MINGKIIKIIENKKIVILRDNFESCSNCISKSSCTSKIPDNQKEIEIPYEKGYNVGDEIIYEIKPYQKIVLAFLIFFLPILIIIFSFIISRIITKNEIINILISFLFTTIYFIILKILYNFNILNFLNGKIMKK